MILRRALISSLLTYARSASVGFVFMMVGGPQESCIDKLRGVAEDTSIRGREGGGFAQLTAQL